MSKEERYKFMQKDFYDRAAKLSDYEKDTKTDFVVGCYHDHDNWRDYDDYLMRYVDDAFKSKIALEFACGPARNIIKYHGRFARIDGCDIAAKNLENGRKNLQFAGLPVPNLILTNGDDLGNVPDDHYDFIFSTIAMQHICVYNIRRSIFQAMIKTLKPGGRISIQMGFGKDSPNTVDYFANNYDALTTNRGCDVCISDPEQLKSDLESLGYVEFEHWIRPVGPGDVHPNWIFFTAVKPAR